MHYWLIVERKKERSNLIDMVDEKVTSIRNNGGSNRNAFQLTRVPTRITPDSHCGMSLLQTKMDVIQILFHTYKIVSIELQKNRIIHRV